MNWVRDPRLWVVAFAIVIVLLASKVREQKSEIQALQHQLEQPTTAPEDVGDGVRRSGSTLLSEDDFDDHVDDAGVPMAPVQSDADKRGTKVMGVNTAGVGTKGSTASNLPSTRITDAPVSAEPVVPTSVPAPPACPFQNTVEHLSLAETFPGLSETVPWGEVSFAASQQRPWSLDVFPRRLTLSTVLARRENGTHDVYSHLTLDVRDRRYTLPLDTTNWVEALPSPRFRWSAKLYLGPTMGVGVVPSVRAALGASLLASVASYGRLPELPDWAFGLFGVGYVARAQAPNLSFVPAAYNVGRHLPLLDALYLGPVVSFDPFGEVVVGAFLGAKL